MKRLTAVIAAVAALGMATPGLSESYDQQSSEMILLQGEPIGTIGIWYSDIDPDKAPFLMVKFRGKLYSCQVMVKRLGTTKAIPICWDSE